MLEIGLQIDHNFELRRRQSDTTRRALVRRQKLKERPTRRYCSLQNKIDNTTDSKPTEDVLNTAETTGIFPLPTMAKSLARDHPINANPKGKEKISDLHNSLDTDRAKTAKKAKTDQKPRKRKGRLACTEEASLKEQGSKRLPSSFTENEKQRPRNASNPQSSTKRQPSRRKKIATEQRTTVRALSFDDLYRSRNFSEITPFQHEHSPPPEVQNAEYLDAGSQILGSYSNRMEYNASSPKASSKGRVKTFFRRLAGSLESLLRIRRKSWNHQPRSYAENKQSERSYNNPLFANYSPYITIDNDAENDQRKKTDSGTKARDEVVRFPHSQHILEGRDCSRSGPRRIAFSRGKRVYVSSGEQKQVEQNLNLTPVPPMLSDARRRNSRSAFTRRKLKHFQLRHTNRPDSVDWETKSDTDSEGCVFRSNNLRYAISSKTYDSDTDTEYSYKKKQNETKEFIKNHDEYSGAPGHPQFVSKLCDTEENAISSFKSPSDKGFDQPLNANFSPPGTSQSNVVKKGPLRAIREVKVTSFPVRAESTGKFEAPTRVAKRKIRRRNSSFLPGNTEERGKPSMMEASLKQAESFEHIMNSIHEIANKLDQVRICAKSDLLSKKSLNRSESCKGTEEGFKTETESNQAKVRGVMRRESWVGKVSSRLDKLIEAESDKKLTRTVNHDSQNGVTQFASVELNTEKSDAAEGEDLSSVPTVEKLVRRVSRKNSTVVHQEKISFDELEQDFKHFARGVRQRERQSTEKMHAVGDEVINLLFCDDAHFTQC